MSDMEVYHDNEGAQCKVPLTMTKQGHKRQGARIGDERSTRKRCLQMRTERIRPSFRQLYRVFDKKRWMHARCCGGKADGIAD